MPKHRYMISYKRTLLAVFLVFYGIQAEAQSGDSTQINKKSFQDAYKLKASTPINALEITKENGIFQLKDHVQAAKYDSLWLKTLYESASMYDELQSFVSPLEIDSTSNLNSVEIDSDLLKERLTKLDQKTPFNISYNPSLEMVIKSFLSKKHEFIERMIVASQFYFPLFEQELDNYNIPLEIKYLAIVESALNPRAKSRVGATGLWQFMYSTGKMYGLDVSSYVDERSDPIKSTKAACAYLSKLYDIFGDWDLALAAYNSGPGNVNKAIRRSGGYTNYWNIRRNLPRETAGYVPAFLATMYLFEYAEEYGIKKVKIDRPYFETDTVHVKELITFDHISELVGVSKEELELLNPSYKLGIIPKIENKNYVLRLPKNAIGKYVANEDVIYAHVKQDLKSKESPLPEMVQAQDRIRYKVRSGDYLGKIADRYGVGVSQIKQWNGLRSNNLRIGQRLTIFPRKPVTTSTPKTSNSLASTSAQKSTGSDLFKVHTVQSGDSLWTISRKYPGITIDDLRKWNRISGNNLKPGTKLRLCDCSS